MSEDPAVARARALLDAGRSQDAISTLGPYLASNPDDVRALCVLAQAHLRLSDGERALVAAQAAVAADPGEEWAVRLLSSALVTQGRYNEARWMADEAIRLAPNQWRCHAQLAGVDVAAKTITTSTRRAAQRVVELAPEEADAHLVAGNVALADTKYRAAAAAFREVLRLDPSNASAHNNLGVVALRRRRLGQATSFMVNAAGIDPMSPNYVANIGVAVRAWFSYLAIAGFLLVRIAFVFDTDQGAVALCAALDLALAAVFLLRLSRVGRPAFGRYLRATIRRDAAMRALIALPILGVVCLAIAAAAGRTNGSGWLLGCVACNLAALVLARLIARSRRSGRNTSG